jgi:hypothetical protein
MLSLQMLFSNELESIEIKNTASCKSGTPCTERIKTAFFAGSKKGL